MTIQSLLLAAILFFNLFDLSSVSWAQSAASGLFAEANELYRSGEYEEARNKYLQITADGVRDPRLFYNLGNASFKESRLGDAIVWYERAVQLDPRDDDIRANLRFAHQVKKDREPSIEQNALLRALEFAYLFPTVNELSVSCALFLCAVWIVASLRWLRSRSNSWQAWTLLPCASLSILTSILLASRIYDLEEKKFAIVTVQEAMARSGPGSGQTPVFVLHEGTKIEIDRAEGSWYLIRLPNGSAGWMSDVSITII